MKWREAIKEVKERGYRIPISVPRDSLPYPSLKRGFKKSIGEPEGQEDDFRKRIDKKSSLHVRVFRDHYEIHLDMYDPEYNALLHLIFDAPEILISLILAVVLSIYAMRSIYRSKKGQRWWKTLVYLSLVAALSVFTYFFVKIIREVIDKANDRQTKLKSIFSA